MPNVLGLLASAALIQSAPPADAQQEEPYVVMWVAARPESCNLAAATTASFEELVTDPERWEGKCVAVGGFWQEQALFAIARDARRGHAQSTNALSGRRVGIYGTEELLASAPRTPVAYTAVGIAGQCDSLAEGAIMVMGYCHYTGGPYIAVAEMHRR